MRCDEHCSPSTLSAAAGMKGQTKTEMKNPEIGTAEPFQSFSQTLCQPHSREALDSNPGHDK